MSWQAINDYIVLAKAGSDLSLHFVGRHPSNDNERRAAIRSIAASVVDHIDKEAVRRLSAFPKPNEAISWAELGVADDNLFPPELLKITRDAEKSLKKGTVLDDCNLRKAWERVIPQGTIVDGRRDGQRELPSWTTALIVLHALSDKNGPFHHLAPLVYLASHARVPFMRVAAIDLPMLSPGPTPSAGDEFQDNNANTIHVDFGHSKPVPALQKFATACLSQWIFLSIIESLENGPETFANGMCRDMPVFPRDMGSYFLDVGPVHRLVQPHYEPESMLTQGLTESSRGLKNKKNPGRFHHDFWCTDTDGKRSEQDPAALSAYKDRCLDIFIAYRTLMLAAHQRNSSVGDREFASLAAEHLTSTSVHEVLSRLGYPLSGALSDPMGNHIAYEAIMEELLATTRAEVKITEADVPTNPALQTSSFLKLPPEIIFDDIASLLPVQAVYELVRTCSRLRQILLPQVYADTCQILQPTLTEAVSRHGGTDDIKLLTRIAKHNQLLLATPHLRGHVRHAQTMRVFTLPAVRHFRHFDDSLHQLPLFCPLAKSFTNLVSASLSVNDLTADPQAVVAPDFLCKLVVHLVRTYPKLRSLELLLYLREPMGGLVRRQSHHPINDTSTMAEVANIELPTEPTLTVQDFSVRVLDNPMHADPMNAHPFGGSIFNGFDPALSPALPRLAMMMASSVRYLELDVVDDILISIPALPHVITLEIKTGISPRVLENVLRDSFPNLARLLLTYRPMRRSVAPPPAPGGAPLGMNAGLVGGMQGLLNGILGGPLPGGAVQAGAGVIQGPFFVPAGGPAAGGVFPGGFGGGGDEPEDDGPGAVSFASCLPNLKRMAISGYDAKSLPGGVQTLVLLSEDLLSRAKEPPRYVSGSVTRVTLDPPNEDEPVPNPVPGNPFGQRRQLRAATGPSLFGAGLGGLVAAYPGMKCIELYELPRGVSWRLEKADDVISIVKYIEDLIPGLEALVLTLPRFAYRPKRVDYPVDDGLDIEERELAISVFMMAPSLKYLSVTGLDFWDTTWMRRRRTWVQKPMPENHNSVQGNTVGQDHAEEEGEDELHCRCWSDQYGEHRDLFKVSAVYGKGGLPDFVTGAKPLQDC